jgi:putative endonuclease
MAKLMWVYILASPSRELYVGVTNDLRRRWGEHQDPDGTSHSARHGTRHLVYYEAVSGQLQAIAREKEIKRWRRLERLDLVESMNPMWRDLAADMGWVVPSSSAALRA